MVPRLLVWILLSLTPSLGAGPGASPENPFASAQLKSARLRQRALETWLDEEAKEDSRQARATRFLWREARDLLFDTRKRRIFSWALKALPPKDPATSRKIRAARQILEKAGKASWLEDRRVAQALRLALGSEGPLKALEADRAEAQGLFPELEAHFLHGACQEARDDLDRALAVVGGVEKDPNPLPLERAARELPSPEGRPLRARCPGSNQPFVRGPSGSLGLSCSTHPQGLEPLRESLEAQAAKNLWARAARSQIALRSSPGARLSSPEDECRARRQLWASALPLLELEVEGFRLSQLEDPETHAKYLESGWLPEVPRRCPSGPRFDLQDLSGSWRATCPRHDAPAPAIPLFPPERTP